MSTLRLKIFDNFVLYVDDHHVPLTQRLQDLLAYLALHRDKPLSRLKTAEQVSAPHRDKNNVTSPAGWLRKAMRELLTEKVPQLADMLISTDPIQWKIDIDFVLDVDQFSSALSKKTKAIEVGNITEAIKSCEEVIQLYGKNGLFPDCLADWIIEVKKDLHFEFAKTLKDLINLLEQQKNYNAAINYAKRALDDNDEDEEIYIMLLRLYGITDNFLEVQRIFQLYERIFRKIFNQEPSESILEAYKKALKLQSSWQYAPLLTPLTRLIGRDKEVSTILAWLTDSYPRLATIVGLGGLGKTRLATEVGWRFADSNHDVCFISLVTVHTDDSLIQVIAQALHYPLSDSDNAKQELFEFLYNKNLLLILDNFEHLFAQKHILLDILENTRYCKLLVTSRRNLNLKEGRIFPIDGLQYPEIDITSDKELSNEEREKVVKSDAVTLFKTQACFINPEFHLEENEKYIAKICKTVHGMPLAIEMLASWVKILSCSEILDKLKAQPRFLESSKEDQYRHHSMTIVFEETWHMLTVNEQRIFLMLTILNGSFSLEAAGEIAHTKFVKEDKEKLINLIDTHLIRSTSNERYNMHPLLRQYGLERLKTNSVLYRTAGESHCIYFAKLVKIYADEISMGKASAFQSLRLDIGNIKKAWRYAMRHPEIKQLENLFFGFLFFYANQGLSKEGIKLFDEGIKQFDERIKHLLETRSSKKKQTALAQLKMAKAQLEIGKAHMIMLQGNLVEAIMLAEQSQPFFEMSDFQKYATLCLLVRGVSATWQGNIENAKKFLLETKAKGEAIKFDYARGTAYLHLGDIERLQKNYSEAYQWYEHSLILAEELKSIRGKGITLTRLGTLAADENNFELAERLYREGQRVAEEGGDLWVREDNFCGQIKLALRQENYEGAKALLRNILNTRDELQNHLPTVIALASQIMTKEGMDDQIIEYLTFVINNSTTPYETKLMAELLLYQVSSNLPISKVEMLQTLGKTRTLSNTMNEIRIWLS